MWHTNQLGKVRLRLVCLPLRKPFLCMLKQLKEQRKHISKCKRERPNEWDSEPKARWSLKEVRGVGWELVEVEEKGGRSIVNQAALLKVGTCKSGERRVGTRPNDSSTALYKYSRTGSTRLLLLVAKKPWDTGVSPSWRKVFNSLLIVFQSHPDLKANRTSLAYIKWQRALPLKRD